MDYLFFKQSIDLKRTCNVCQIRLTNNKEIEDFIRLNTTEFDKYKLIKANDAPKVPFYYLSSYNIINDEIVPDIVISRKMHNNLLRKEREKKLVPLDVAFMRAVERGDVDKQKEIAAEKQKLRDITTHPAIENATTVEELSKLSLEKLLTL